MIGILQTAFAYIVPYLLVLTLVVTVHELGHFLAAKACDVAIDRFSIGFGKALASWKDRSGVEWRIGWIPFGGYVRFAGDENAASVPDQEDLETLRRDIVKREGAQALGRYYHFKPVWQRAVIAAAGPVSNFVLAITIFAAMAMALGETILVPQIASIDAGSPAARAGFQAGDLILKANGRAVDNFEALPQLAQLRVNLPTEFVVRRDGREANLTVTPAWQLREDGFHHMRRQGTLGLHPVVTTAAIRHLTYNPVQAVGKGVDQAWDVLSSTTFYLGRMVIGQVSADQLSGPLGIARMSGDVARQSTRGAPDIGTMLLSLGVNLLRFAALVSVSIGFLNLLPIPVLDGGHLLFYAYEAMARRPLAAKVQAAGYRLGLALVLGLLLFGTWNDLQQLSVLKILGGS
jgi:regulator of sigma E protease